MATARMFGTVEDLFTQSFVLPYLTPMLENAGATILIPRERDTQIYEIIIDNDRSTPGSEYKELDGEKAWSDGEKAGFGIFKLLIRMGRTLLRKVPIGRRSHRGKEKKSHRVDSRNSGIGELRGLCLLSIFSEQHRAGTVYHPSCRRGNHNRRQSNNGGGTWIYLGNFKFTAHEQAHERIVLTNQSNKSGKIITADAIKIGGGMGNIARSPLESPYPIEAETSGYPRFTEAARYWLQWAGIPDSIYSKALSAMIIKTTFTHVPNG